MNERIRKLRKALGLTQEEFAGKIGTKRGTIASYEVGKGNPINTVLFSICREFGVNENWLRLGEGSMFIEASFDEIEQLVKRYNLPHTAKYLITCFMKLNEQEMYSVIGYIERLLEENNKESVERLNGLTKDEYIKQAAQSAAQEAEKQAEMDWEQAKKGKNQGSLDLPSQQTDTAQRRSG